MVRTACDAVGRRIASDGAKCRAFAGTGASIVPADLRSSLLCWRGGRKGGWGVGGGGRDHDRTFGCTPCVGTRHTRQEFSNPIPVILRLVNVEGSYWRAWVHILDSRPPTQCKSRGQFGCSRWRVFPVCRVPPFAVSRIACKTFSRHLFAADKSSFSRKGGKRG